MTEADGPKRGLPRWAPVVLVVVGSIGGAAVLAEVAGVGDTKRPDDHAVVARSSTTSTTAATDAPHSTLEDTRLVTRLLPDFGRLGAGWVLLNKDPEGPDDPTLPTAPEITADCGGSRAVLETGAAFALFERRRGFDLDEQAFAYGLLFDSTDDAGAQVALYRSATFESCLLEGMVDLYDLVGINVDAAWEDRSLPLLDDGVTGSGRTLRATTTVDGITYEALEELTVLQSGRAVSLIIRDARLGAPEPFPIDGLVEDESHRLAALNG